MELVFLVVMKSAGICLASFVMGVALLAAAVLIYRAYRPNVYFRSVREVRKYFADL